MANPNPSPQSRFQKGHKLRGRKPGQPNLKWRDIKTIIRMAAEEVGYIRRVPVLDAEGKPVEPKVWDHSLLKEAWVITDGKDEAGMYEAVTQRFGSFPITFRGLRGNGREVEVGIFGVYCYPPDFDRGDYPRRGYLDCDVRILGERDGPWRSSHGSIIWSAYPPTKDGLPYYKPTVTRT